MKKYKFYAVQSIYCIKCKHKVKNMITSCFLDVNITRQYVNNKPTPCSQSRGLVK